MKKYLVLVLGIVMMFSMVACGEKSEEESTKTESTVEPKAGDTMTVEEIVDAIQKDVADLPKVGNIELTEENFEYYAFTTMREGVTAIASDAMINAIAHSVVVVRAEDKETADLMAKEISAQKNPHKWVCVEAEKSTVVVQNNTILLVMSTTATTDAIVDNFNALWK